MTIRAGLLADLFGLTWQQKNPARSPMPRGWMPQPQMHSGPPIASASHTAQRNTSPP